MAFSEDADEFHHLDSRECVSPFVLVSWKDCNKLPQTVQLKTSETSFKLTSGKMVSAGHCFLKQTECSHSLPFPASGGQRCPWACGCAPACAPIVTLLLPLLHKAFSIFALQKGACDMYLGPNWIIQNTLLKSFITSILL